MRLSFTVTMAVLLLMTRLTSAAELPAAKKPDDNPLRIVIVGLVHGHAQSLIEQALRRADVEIVGVAEPDRQLASQFAARFGWTSELLFEDLETMLQKTRPEAAVLFTSTYDHLRVVEIGARHGVHVMMEKPLAVSLQHGQAIQNAARKGNIQVLVNYETSWYRNTRAAYDLVKRRTLGDIRKVVVHDGHAGPKKIGVGPEFLTWLTDPKLNGGGALFDFGCYGADLTTWLMDGRRPITVTAITQRLQPEVYLRVDDEATIILTYADAQAIFQASWNWPFDRKDMEIYGESGYAITVGRDNIRVRQHGADEKNIAAAPLAPPHDAPLSLLRAVIRDGVQPDGLSSLETNMLVTEILDAARRSAAQGKTIRLAPR